MKPGWITLCNGELASQLPIDDRSAALGDGLFETVLVRHSRAIWLDEHLQRLAEGCSRLSLDFPETDLRRDVQVLLRAVGADTDAVLRIQLGRRAAGRRGYAPTTRASNRWLQISATGAPQRQYWDRGIKAFLCQTRLPELPATAGIKHNNRLAHVLARAERNPGDYAEGLMLSQSGLILEGISSNVFLVIDGALHTPSLELAGVQGVVRQKVLECAEQLGLARKIRRIGFDELYRAQELFFCNSLIGIWPVRSLDCLQFAAPIVTTALQSRLENVWYA